jgi:hypothetical protein
VPAGTIGYIGYPARWCESPRHAGLRDSPLIAASQRFENHRKMLLDISNVLMVPRGRQARA